MKLKQILHSSVLALLIVALAVSPAFARENEVMFSSGILTEDEWQHITWTFQNGHQVIYRNGLLYNEATYETENLPDVAGLPFKLGGADWTDHYSATYFDLDEFAFYSRALTAEEISDRVNNLISPSELDGIVSYWSFDETEGNTVIDSVSSNNGTLENGVERTPDGKYGSAIRFDGELGTSFPDSCEHVLIPDASNLNPVNEVTIEFWIKPTIDAQTSNGLIFGKGEFDGPGEWWGANLATMTPDPPPDPIWGITTQLQREGSPPEPGIYIRADGSVEGTDKIQRDGNIYTFTGDVYEFIIVEKDYIIIDGAGYEVIGPGSGSESGIALEGRTGVTVKNLLIANFWAGFYLRDCVGNILLQNTANDNIEAGFYLENSYGNILRGNTADGNQWRGFQLHFSSDNTLWRNTATGNDAGFGLFDSSENTLIGNKATNGIHGFLITSSNENILLRNTGSDNTFGGFTLGETSSGNILRQNTAEDNMAVGFFLEYAYENVLLRNMAIGSGFSLMYSDNNFLRRNTVENGGCGCFGLLESSGNILIKNTVVSGGQPEEVGFFLDYSDGNILKGNTANDLTYQGFRLTFSFENTLQRNTANNNGDTGFELRRSDGNILRGNTANDNGVYGFAFYWASGNTLIWNTACGNGEWDAFQNSASDNLFKWNSFCSGVYTEP